MKIGYFIIGAAILVLGIILAVTLPRRPVGTGPMEESQESHNAVPSALRKVNVYFSNSELDPEVSCTKVFPVTREIEDTPAVARAALLELLEGPTAAEKEAGYFTNINSGVGIKSIAIENGVARVDFDSAMEKGVGGSCRVTAIRAEVSETLLQFPTVTSVVIAVEGRVKEALQP